MRFQTLVFYEVRKILSNRIGVLLLAGAAFFLLFVMSWRYINAPEDRNVWERESELDGRIMDEAFFEEFHRVYFDENDGEKQDLWLQARKYMTKVFRYSRPSSGVYGPEFYDDWSADLLYSTREDVIHDFADEFCLTEEERAYWKEREALIGRPFTYRSTRNVQMVRDSYQFTLVMTCMLIGLFLSGSFAGETEKRTDALVYSAKHGHGKTLAAKMTAGCLFSLITGCVMLFAAQIPVAVFGGLQGLNAPWYMVTPFSSISIKAWKMLLLHTLVLLLGCVLTGVLTMLLSMLFDRSIAAAGSIFVLVIADLFLSIPTRLRILSQIRYLTPCSVLLNTNVPDMRLIRVFGKYLISLQAGPFLYLLLGVVLVAASLPLFQRRCMRR